ncbi:hypothetical protein B0H66DRAFT_314669 [Apodospora peruviana]|uniref:Rhodopsin domain-containing protein n=1 Tax=Apodospora peruviana TaxID=516989 RepID=A0AAE0M0A5_9PEZI|nr:hypothetical protein B0H66DRAFT_314669 [Apodospora peruviana]
MSPLPPPARPPPIPDDLSTVSHQGAGPQVNSVCWTLFGLCTGFLALRLYCKRLSRHGLWWDDWILVVAWCIHFVAAVLLSIMITRGYGNHPWDQIWGVTPEEILYMWVRNTLAMTAAAWSKTAFAVTLLRFAEGWVKWAVWFILVSMNIIIAINATMNWVGCDPIQKSWNPAMPGTCAYESLLPAIISIGNVGGGYSAACDFVLAFLPWAIIWKLQMQLKEKLGVGIAMSCGVIAGVMAAVKTAHLINLDTGDSYDAAVLNIWDSAEVSVTIIAASIPTLRVLFRDLVNSSGKRNKYYTTSDTAGSKSQGQTHSVIVKSRQHQLKNNMHDGGSDESILNMAQGRIFRTDEIEVKHGDMSDGEHVGADQHGFELQPVSPSVPPSRRHH